MHPAALYSGLFHLRETIQKGVCLHPGLRRPRRHLDQGQGTFLDEQPTPADLFLMGGTTHLSLAWLSDTRWLSGRLSPLTCKKAFEHLSALTASLGTTLHIHRCQAAKAASCATEFPLQVFDAEKNKTLATIHLYPIVSWELLLIDVFSFKPASLWFENTSCS